jgi:phospholipase/carboxylesterase
MKRQLPQRRGQQPETTDTNPHCQLTQNAPESLQELLWERMAGLPETETGPSLVSVPGARAVFMCGHCAGGPPSSFMKAREFSHIHPAHDGSLHVTLPDDVRDEVLEKGWAEPHPLAARGLVPASVVMLYGPRDPEEFKIIWTLVQESHRFAGGAAGGRSAWRSDAAE